MKRAGVGSRERGATLKVKKASHLDQAPGQLKGSQNIVMLGICLNEKSFRCKEKKKIALLFLKS